MPLTPFSRPVLTVGELQERLQTYRADMPVLFRDEDGQLHLVEADHGETVVSGDNTISGMNIAAVILSTRQAV